MKLRRALVTVVALVVPFSLSVACTTTTTDAGGRSGAPGSTASVPGGSTPPTAGGTAPGTAPAAASPPAASPSPGCTATGSPGSTPPPTDERTIDVGGVPRTYRVAVPTLPALASPPVPLLVLLHGLGSSAEDIDRVSDLPRKGTGRGFVVVTPDATGPQKLWRSAAQGPDADLLDALVAKVEQELCIDTARIGVVGFSAGAAFAAAYSCARQDRIAALVTVAVEFPLGCKEPMPIVAFHGTADPIVPYQTTDPNAPGVTHGTEANMAEWAKASRCGTEPKVDVIGSEVTRLTWPDCVPGSDVVLYKVIGGGHDWPGKDPATAVHPSTQQVSATDEGLSFLASHPLRR